MKIDWKKYVDQIYCITLASKDNTKLHDELKRVDILDSEIYYEAEFLKSPLYKRICEKCYNAFNSRNDGFTYSYNYVFDITLNNYWCMKHAQLHNYNRILIIEDDCVFLKNKEDIINILEQSYNILNEENGLFIGQLYYINYSFNNIGWSSKKTFFYEQDHFISNIIKFDLNKSTILGGAAFNIYCKDAYEFFIKSIESFNDLYENDNYDQYIKNDINVFFNETPICIQYKDIFYHINWFYLYNADIYYDFILNFNKESFLSNFKNEYYNEVINGSYVLMELVKKYYIDYFNQINMLIFHNKLNINDFINDNT